MSSRNWRQFRLGLNMLGDKAMLQQFNHCNGISYASKMVSLYEISSMAQWINEWSILYNHLESQEGLTES